MPYVMNSLFTQCIDYIVRNVQFYFEDLENMSHLPSPAKDKILRKLTRTACLSNSPSFKSFLTALVHDKLIHIDLVSVPIDDDTLKILHPCTNLKELFLTKEQETTITTKGLLDFFETKPRAFLIQLSNCPAVTDEVVGCIAKNCLVLAGLEVCGCKNITDRSLEILAEIEQLRWLGFSGTNVTDEGVVILGHGKCANNLEELRLNFCPKLTYRAFSVSKFCPNLQVLDCQNCVFSASADSSIFNHNLKKLKRFTWTITFNK